MVVKLIMLILLATGQVVKAESEHSSMAECREVSDELAKKLIATIPFIVNIRAACVVAGVDT